MRQSTAKQIPTTGDRRVTRALRSGLSAVLVGLLLTLTAAYPAFAQSGMRLARPAGFQLGPIAVQKSSIGPGQAASAVASMTGGRVIGVSRSGNNYRVKVLTKKGRVRTYRVDARSGRVVK